jgi:hypothetical protein
VRRGPAGAALDAVVSLLTQSLSSLVVFGQTLGATGGIGGSGVAAAG